VVVGGMEGRRRAQLATTAAKIEPPRPSSRRRRGHALGLRREARQVPPSCSCGGSEHPVHLLAWAAIVLSRWWPLSY
jgi:hypothetical protein